MLPRRCPTHISRVCGVEADLEVQRIALEVEDEARCEGLEAEATCARAPLWTLL